MAERLARRVVVHIGTPKTGSSTIQTFLSRNRSALLEQGIATPEHLGSNHQWLAGMVFDADRGGRQLARLARRAGFTAGLPGPDAWRALQAEHRRDLVTWARTSDADTLLLTCEDLFYGLSASELGRLVELVGELADEATVLVYLREPIARAISGWNTQLRSGGTYFDPMALPAAGSTWPGSTGAPQWDYAAQLASWEQRFPGQVTARLFDPAVFVNGDLLHDFCAVVGLDWRPDFVIPPRGNETISWPTMKVLNAVNRRIPAFLPDGEVNPARGLLGRAFLRADAGGIRYRPSAAEVAAYREAFAASNEWVRRTYFPDRDELWTTLVEPRDPGTDALYASELTETEQTFADFVVATWLDS